MLEILYEYAIRWLSLVALVIAWVWPVIFTVAFYLESDFNKWFRRIVAVIVLVPLCAVYYQIAWPYSDEAKKSPYHLLVYWNNRLHGPLPEDAKPVRTDLPGEIRRYRLDGWVPPKHFYVDLTDVKTGQSMGRVYVSKHCNTQFLREGEEYNLQVQPYTLSTQPSVVHYEFIGLFHAFCRG